MQTQFIESPNVVHHKFSEVSFEKTTPSLHVIDTANADEQEIDKQIHDSEAHKKLTCNMVAGDNPPLKYPSRSVLNNFEKNIPKLIDFIKAHDHFPGYIENRQLSQWVSSQRNAFSKGLMHPVLKAKLDAINFIWSQNDYKWNEQYLIAQQIINENVQHKKKLKTFPWLRYQINAYKQGSLTANRKSKIQKLLQLTPANESITDELTATWYNNYKALIEFRENSYKMWPAIDDASDISKQLISWRNVLQLQIRHGLLSEEWQIKLNCIPTDVLSNKQKKWVTRCKEVKHYIEINGHPPDRNVWGIYQRYRWLVNGYNSAAEKEKALFDSLNIRQPTLRKKWHEYYSDLQQYIAANHELPTGGQGNKLAAWLKLQINWGVQNKLSRDRYEKLQNAGVQFKKRPPRPAKQKMSIETVKKQLEERWNARLQELIVFRQQNPYRWPDSNSAEKSLSLWCNAQRQAASGRIRYKLPSHRYEKLNAIGFIWWRC